MSRSIGEEKFKKLGYKREEHDPEYPDITLFVKKSSDMVLNSIAVFDDGRAGKDTWVNGRPTVELFEPAEVYALMQLYFERGIKDMPIYD